MKVFPPEVSTFYRHIFELQKLICNTVRQTHAAFLEPLGHSRDIARLSLFDKYYFSRYLSKFNELVPLPNSRGLSTRYSVKLHGFFFTVARYCKHNYFNSFFLRTARLWYSLSVECFSLSYDLNSFNPIQDGDKNCVSFPLYLLQT